MCAWAGAALGTDQFYWTSDVCTYDGDIYTGGCTGSPLAGVQYKVCKTAVTVAPSDHVTS